MASSKSNLWLRLGFFLGLTEPPFLIHFDAIGGWNCRRRSRFVPTSGLLKILRVNRTCRVFTTLKGEFSRGTYAFIDVSGLQLDKSCIDRGDVALLIAESDSTSAFRVLQFRVDINAGISHVAKALIHQHGKFICQRKVLIILR